MCPGATFGTIGVHTRIFHLRCAARQRSANGVINTPQLIYFAVILGAILTRGVHLPIDKSKNLVCKTILDSC